MSIVNHFSWPSVVQGRTSSLIVTERRVFFNIAAKPQQISGLTQSSDDRAIMSAFPKDLKSATITEIKGIQLLEGSDGFEILCDDEKINIQFGNVDPDVVANHFAALIESLEGFRITSDSKAGALDNLAYPIMGIFITAGLGGLMGYFLNQDEFGVSGRRAGLAKLTFDLAHSLGGVGISVCVIVGVLLSALAAYHRMKNPLRMFIASKAP